MVILYSTCPCRQTSLETFTVISICVFAVSHVYCVTSLACFECVAMGVGSNFSRGRSIVDFSKDFPGGSKSGEISFFPHSKLIKEPFRAENFVGKCPILKSRRGETPHFRRSCMSRRPVRRCRELYLQWTMKATSAVLFRATHQRARRGAERDPCRRTWLWRYSVIGSATVVFIFITSMRCVVDLATWGQRAANACSCDWFACRLWASVGRYIGLAAFGKCWKV